MGINNENTITRKIWNLQNALESLSGRKFIRPNYPEQGMLFSVTNMENLSLELYDSNGIFCGCYIKEQIRYIGSERFKKSIQIL